MNYPQAVQEPKQRKSTWMDTAQLVVSILVVLVFFGISILSFVGVAVSGTLRELREAIPSFWTMGFVFLFLAGIALVSAIKSRQVYYDKTKAQQPKKDTKWIYFSIAFLPPLLVAGYFVINAPRMPAFLLPLNTVLALSVAMLWILKLGLRDSWGANVKRDSGLFSFSMSFSTFYILLLEIFVFVIVVAITMATVFKNIDLGAMLNNLTLNPETYLEDMSFDGNFVLLVLFVITISGPIIEELFKTIGVWFLKPRHISPREGWIAGLMSGAGFGLIESLMFGAVQGVLMTNFPDWLYFVLGRAGALVLHTFTGGIVGWGLAKSWREKRPKQALGAYIIAFLVHSLWNSNAVVQGLLSQFSINVPDATVYFSLGFLFVAIMVAYLMLSHKIMREPIDKDHQPSPYLPHDPAGMSNWSV
ncbi:MAG TPA: PrsW family intramembrane metalloprotease [Anaerolineaceae bacterium]|nr:PrsW family intramembrane metalloprotease [Anaerolineaceae bacterium]